MTGRHRGDLTGATLEELHLAGTVVSKHVGGGRPSPSPRPSHLYPLTQHFSTFLTLRLFNSVPHVVVTPQQ